MEHTMTAHFNQNDMTANAIAALANADTDQCQRPWGFYESLMVGKMFQIKRICVKPGGVLSLQSHIHRSEHWIVVEGCAKVTIDEQVSIMGENRSIFVPLGAVHRLENPGKVELTLIEVQFGSYLGEDDIIRYDDIYGRAPKAV
jgi:mannose-6-phosphate isomerase-like protein (cupin superfamily)